MVCSNRDTPFFMSLPHYSYYWAKGTIKNRGANPDFLY